MTDLKDEIISDLLVSFDTKKSFGEQAQAIIDLIIARIPPLVWEEPCAKNNWIYQAHAPWGTYGIHICGGRHQAWLEAHEKPYEQWIGDGYVGSVLEAKAAANAHYVTQLCKGMGIE